MSRHEIANTRFNIHVPHMKLPNICSIFFKIRDVDDVSCLNIIRHVFFLSLSVIKKGDSLQVTVNLSIHMKIVVFVWKNWKQKSERV